MICWCDSQHHNQHKKSARKETLLSLFSLSQPGLWHQYLLQAVSSWFLTWRVSADYDVDTDDAFHDHEANI